MNDKLKHFIACAVITLLVLTALAFAPYMYGWDKAIALAVGIAAAASKEIIWDKMMGRGTAEFYDFLAGVYGAFAAMFAWAIVETIVLAIL